MILETLRKNHFLVDDTCVKLQDLVLQMMEKNGGEQSMAIEEDELMCQIDYMPVEKHNSKHLGCRHTVCNECWVDYIEQKIREGHDCIHSKCPVHGCSREVTLEIIETLVNKQSAKM